MSNQTGDVTALTFQQRKQILLQLQKKQADVSRARILPRQGEHSLFPLSFAQERFWFLDQLHPQSNAHNLPLAVRLRGPFDRAALHQSLATLMLRHENLRTTFVLEAGHPQQVIASGCPVPWYLVDLSSLEQQAREKELQRQLRQDIQHPYDLQQGPLWRTRIWQLAPQEHVLLLSTHHIISDGWSLQILLQELIGVYQGVVNEAPLQLAPLSIQYADYALWQRNWLQGQELEQHLTYWKEHLAGASELSLPTDYRRPPQTGLRGGMKNIQIPPTLYKEIMQFSHQEAVTLFMLLLTAFYELLFLWTEQPDITLGTVIANRQHVETEHLIGCFINFLPLRTRLASTQTGRQALQQIRDMILASYAHQECPFEKVVEALQPEQRSGSSALYSVAFLLQNYASSVPTLSPQSAFQVFTEPLDIPSAQLDLRFILQERADTLAVICEYNPDLFSETTIEALLHGYEQVLTHLVTRPEQTVQEMHFSAELLQQASQARERERPYQIVLAATFTAEPVEESLTFWMRQLAQPFTIQFTPYHQVFQQLLDPNSSLMRNRRGINILLLRLEDWLRYTQPEPAESEASAGAQGSDEERLSGYIDEFLAALRNACRDAQVPFLLCLCPSSATGEEDAPEARIVQQQEQRLLAALQEQRGVSLLTASTLLSRYPVRQVIDRHADALGHIPFTPAFFTALGTGLMRTIMALRRSPYKVIVLDCDYTLWHGICGEDGALGIDIDAASLTLQQFMLQQQQQGMLLVLCSKNNEQDVLEVFAQRPEMLLKPEHFVSWRINWHPKSENLKELAQELGVGLESFILVDDDPRECAEVQAHCPSVIVAPLPAERATWPRFLQHHWAFDQLRVTGEDRQRTAMYQQERQRQALLQETETLETFLQRLNLQVQITELSLEQIERVAQLLQRTNQLNTTTLRYNEADLLRIRDAPDQMCLTVEVNDRFGTYGLVGVMLLTREALTLTVDALLLSCRVLGRGVEHQMLAHVGKLALQQRDLVWVNVLFVPSARNQPALEFLESEAATYKTGTGTANWSYRLPTRVAAASVYTPSRQAAERSEQQADPQATSKPVDLSAQLFASIATELASVEAIQQRMAAALRQERRETTPWEAPHTLTEELLVQIWSLVLHSEQVGIHDNFFTLGGHSLLATQIVARVRAVFQVDLSLSALFEEPTIAGLARRIEQAQRGAEGERLPSLTTAPRAGHLPLSFAQERLWLLDQLFPGNAAYNLALAARLEGKLHIAALSESLRLLVRKHETLRTTFAESEGYPVQTIHAPYALPLICVDLQSLPEAEQEQQLHWLMSQEAGKPYDLAHGPLLRAHLWQLGPEKSILLLGIHHIISDGWSIRIMLNELTAIYQQLIADEPLALPELPIQYADYARWQRQWLQGELLQRQIDYWKAQLADSVPLELPLDHPRSAQQTFRGAHIPFQLPLLLSRQIKHLSHHEQVTLFMTLLAAFQVLLARLSGLEDIAVGTPIANRPVAELEEIIGLFANTLVLRTRLEGNPSFREVLQRVREVCLQAYNHQDLPFERLVTESQTQRDLSRATLFQVMFVLQNMPVSAAARSELRVYSLPTETQATMFDLTMSLNETEQGLAGTLEYNIDLFEASSMERLLLEWRVLLEGIVADPDQQIATLPLISETHRQRLLEEWNDTARPYRLDLSVPERFEAQVERTADSIAVLCGDEQLTYHVLNQRANQLAHCLRAAGVVAEMRVGICLKRSPDLLIGLLGIMKAGGTYVPLDASYPRERLAFLLADAQMSLVVLHQELRPLLPTHQAQILTLDTDWPLIEQQPTGNLAFSPQANQTAYVLYTSGSTGLPKGVQIPHRGLVNFLVSMQQEPGFTADDILVAIASLAFDIAGLECYLPLLVGARVCLVSREIAASGEALANLLKYVGATMLQATPVSWRMLLQAGWQGQPGLVALCGGEALQPDLAARLLSRVGRLYNVYGPTETTVWSMLYHLQKLEPVVSIGRPIANMQTYVLDAHLQPLPIGVPGELFIAGSGLGHGYLGRPDLTAERFIPHPFSPQAGARLYCTGDLVRSLPDGNLEYLRRNDQQVKVRGYRIEPAEITFALNQHPAVQNSVVLVRGDEAADRVLVAYIVPHPTRALTGTELRAFLKERIPEYMLPATYVLLDHLPLLPNGKIAWQALPAPDMTHSTQETTYLAPRNATEEALVGIWSRILGLETVGVEDNFFALGGHSLLATQVISRVRHTFGLEFSLLRFFQTPTISGLALAIQEALGQPDTVQRDEEHSFPQVAELSDEEVHALLLELLANEEQLEE